MSRTLLKIAKVIPRLDSDSDHERLASLNVIAKLLALNTDDDDKPAPLKFVDVGIQLAEFAKALGEDDETLTPAPPFTVNPTPQPAPTTSNGFRPAHGTGATPNAGASTPPPSFRPAGQQRPPRPSPTGYKWNPITEEWNVVHIPLTRDDWGSKVAHWDWDVGLDRWGLKPRPAQPAGDGWVWNKVACVWTLTHPQLNSVGWGSDPAHWTWSPSAQRWILPVPPTPQWHTVARRSVSDYEKRCQVLLDKRAYKNQKDKDFLESAYFMLSNGKPLTARMLDWFHDISNRIPY